MTDLDPLLAPSAVAVIGASPDPKKIRGRLVTALKASGRSRPIYPVNPAHKSIQGLRTYGAIGEIGRPVDLALIAIPASKIASALEECADAGVKSVVIYSSGFAESGGASVERQARIREIARARGLLVCGPNSVGFLNQTSGINASFSPSANIGVKGYGVGRRTAIISQSGGLGFALYNRGVRRGMHFSHVISSGNEANLSALDYTEYLLEADEVGAIIILLEQVRGGGRFLDVAARAAALRKPLIVAKFGQSKAARRSALSHTGSMTGAEFAYDAVFRHAGVVRAEDQDELLDVAAAFTLCPLPKGRNIGIVTISGGVGVWLADACERRGLSVPELSNACQEELRGFIPNYGGVSNPVDITAQALELGGNIRAIERLYAEPGIDSVVAVAFTAEHGAVTADKKSLAHLQQRGEKPLVYCSYAVPHAEVLDNLSKIGLPCYTSVQGCARGLQVLADYADHLKLRNADVLPRPVKAPPLPKLEAVLIEHAATPYLMALNIPIPESRLVKTAADAVAAAAEIGGQVALKVQSPQVTHKSEVGGVILEVIGASNVRQAFDQVTRLPRDIVLDGVLVQQMAPKGIEMIAGVAWDETFGPLIMVGFGGNEAEILNDTAWAPAPFGEVRAEVLIRSLRAAARLYGNAQTQPADIAALASLLARLSLFAVDNRDHIQELDLNPVVLYEKGAGLIALDALIVTRKN